MFEWLIFVMASYLVWAVSRLGSRVGRMEREVNSLVQRIDFLRREIDKTLPRRTTPPVRSDLPMEPPIRAEPPPIGGFKDPLSDEPQDTKEGADWARKEDATDGPAEPLPEWDARSLRGIPIPTPPPPRGKASVESLYERPGPREIPAQPFMLPEEGKKNGDFVASAGSAMDVIGRIWNWVILDDEMDDESVGLMDAGAVPRLARLGVIMVVCGAAVFLTWGIAKWHTDATGRVALSVLPVVAMLVAGMLMQGREHRTASLGLLGSGLLAFYFCSYEMGQHGLLSQSQTIGLMVLIAVTAGVLAMGMRSIFIAIVSAAGVCGAIMLALAAAEDASAYLLPLGTCLILAMAGVVLKMRHNAKYCKKPDAWDLSSSENEEEESAPDDEDAKGETSTE